MRDTVLLSVFLLPLTGCVPVAAAAVAAAATIGVIKYTENEARQDFNTDLPTTFTAAAAALRALDYPVEESVRPSATEGKIETKDVKLYVERHTGGITRVRVRVGTFETEDSRRRARLILEELEKQLPAGN